MYYSNKITEQFCKIQECLVQDIRQTESIRMDLVKKTCNYGRAEIDGIKKKGYMEIGGGVLLAGAAFVSALSGDDSISKVAKACETVFQTGSKTADTFMSANITGIQHKMSMTRDQMLSRTNRLLDEIKTEIDKERSEAQKVCDKESSSTSLGSH